MNKAKADVPIGVCEEEGGYNVGKDSNKKVIKAALFGSVAGAVMGLLLAPKSGQELRQDLADQAQKLGDKALVIKDKAQNAVQDVGEKAQVTIDSGKSWLQKKKRFFDNLKTLVSEIQNGALTKTESSNSLEDKKTETPIVEATLGEENIVAALDNGEEDNF